MELDKGIKDRSVAYVRFGPDSLTVLSSSNGDLLRFKSSTQKSFFFLTSFPAFRTFAIRGQ